MLRGYSSLGTKQQKSGSGSSSSDTNDKGLYHKLWKLNWLLAFVHATEAILIAVLTRTSWVENQTIPWVTNFAIGRPMVITQRHYRDIPVGYFPVVFLGLASINHIVCALNPRNLYFEDIFRKSRNRIRWIEYFFSASVMHVHIAMLCGMTDIHALISIFGLSSTTMLFGLISEELSVTGDKAGLKRFILLAGWVPYLFMWFNIMNYFFYSVDNSSPPWWIWTVIFALFFLDCLFAFNSLQAAGFRWFLCGMKVPSYVKVELKYMALSILSKSTLAWFVYGGTRSL
jgi:hypothetical protein